MFKTSSDCWTGMCGNLDCLGLHMMLMLSYNRWCCARFRPTSFGVPPVEQEENRKKREITSSQAVQTPTKGEPCHNHSMSITPRYFRVLVNESTFRSTPPAFCTFLVSLLSPSWLLRPSAPPYQRYTFDVDSYFPYSSSSGTSPHL